MNRSSCCFAAFLLCLFASQSFAGELEEKWHGEWELTGIGKTGVIMTLSGPDLVEGGYPDFLNGKITSGVAELGDEGLIVLNAKWENSYQDGNYGICTLTLSADGESWTGTWVGENPKYPGNGNWSGHRPKKTEQPETDPETDPEGPVLE